METFVYLSMMFSLLSFFSSSSSSTSITLSLSRVTQSSTAVTTKWEELNRLAAASLSRAQRLKKCKPKTPVETPVYPFDGGYSVSLAIGTPPQTLSFILDTGSSLVWMPCTNQYSCMLQCNFRGEEPKYRQIFYPNNSSTSSNVSCDSKKFIHLNPDYRPQKCKPGQHLGYSQNYGSGNTTGNYLFETLTFPELIGQSYLNFLLGCSLTSYNIPYGIAGFGRQLVSLPAQMKLTSFSYCFLSHNYDSMGESSNLVLTNGDDVAVLGVMYIPFTKNPTNSLQPWLSEYYYVPLQSIMVGKVKVKGLERALSLNSSTGNGGTIIDSGTTLTYLEESMFDSFAAEFERQLAPKKYVRNKTAEDESGLGPCFQVPRGRRTQLNDIPKLRFGFEGGTVMDLPLENYFQMNGSVGCLLMFTSIPDPDQGPAVILGNYLQQNYYIQYDLKNNKLGILPTDCRNP